MTHDTLALIALLRRNGEQVVTDEELSDARDWRVETHPGSAPGTQRIFAVHVRQFVEPACIAKGNPT